jgi:hypothetical protein
MWDIVGMVAGVVVIILLFEMLDVAEIVKKRLGGGSPRKDLENRVARMEERLNKIEEKNL